MHSQSTPMHRDGLTRYPFTSGSGSDSEDELSTPVDTIGHSHIHVWTPSWRSSRLGPETSPMSPRVLSRSAIWLSPGRQDFTTLDSGGLIALLKSEDGPVDDATVIAIQRLKLTGRTLMSLTADDISHLEVDEAPQRQISGLWHEYCQDSPSSPRESRRPNLTSIITELFKVGSSPWPTDETQDDVLRGGNEGINSAEWSFSATHLSSVVSTPSDATVMPDTRHLETINSNGSIAPDASVQHGSDVTRDTDFPITHPEAAAQTLLFAVQEDERPATSMSVDAPEHSSLSSIAISPLDKLTHSPQPQRHHEMNDYVDLSGISADIRSTGGLPATDEVFQYDSDRQGDAYASGFEAAQSGTPHELISESAMATPQAIQADITIKDILHTRSQTEHVVVDASAYLQVGTGPSDFFLAGNLGQASVNAVRFAEADIPLPRSPTYATARSPVHQLATPPKTVINAADVPLPPSPDSSGWDGEEARTDVADHRQSDDHSESVSPTDSDQLTEHDPHSAWRAIQRMRRYTPDSPSGTTISIGDFVEQIRSGRQPAHDEEFETVSPDNFSNAFEYELITNVIAETDVDASMLEEFEYDMSFHSTPRPFLYAIDETLDLIDFETPLEDSTASAAAGGSLVLSVEIETVSSFHDGMSAYMDALSVDSSPVMTSPDLDWASSDGQEVPIISVVSTLATSPLSPSLLVVTLDPLSPLFISDEPLLGVAHEEPDSLNFPAQNLIENGEHTRTHVLDTARTLWSPMDSRSVPPIFYPTIPSPSYISNRRFEKSRAQTGSGVLHSGFQEDVTPIVSNGGRIDAYVQTDDVQRASDSAETEEPVLRRRLKELEDECLRLRRELEHARLNSDRSAVERRQS